MLTLFVNTRNNCPASNSKEAWYVAPPAVLDAKKHVIRLSFSFMLCTALIVLTISFWVGRCSVVYVLQQHGNAMRPFLSPSLPSPVFPKSKGVPRTVYTSKHFDTGAISTSDTLLARQAYPDEGSNVIPPRNKTKHNQDPTSILVSMDGSTFISANESVTPSLDNLMGQYEPSGQHLLIDIKEVESAFLNSEHRLVTAMLSVVELSGLTLLSYHCHKLPPIGVSCVGVLLESHISFHTWPMHGVIVLDLFTCGPSSLLPIIPVLGEKFGVPKMASKLGVRVEEPHMKWSHKKRGFRDTIENPEEEMDFHQFLLGWSEFDMKRQIASVKSDIQSIDIYDVIDQRFRSLDSYKKSLSTEDSYEAENPQIFQPDRILYLDGIMQSRLYGEAAYHEALVHPAMITHSNPVRVAIIGGGEGATLREVLKHKTVEKVTMIEIDKSIVEVSKEFLPEWSDCGFMAESTPSCFDDPRLDIIIADATAWFTERYSDASKVDPRQVYDVIIMNARDPSTFVGFSDALIDSDALVQSLTNALGEEGILVSQVGEHELPTSAGAPFSHHKAEHVFSENLVRRGFKHIEDYTDFHGGFMGIWKYKIALKDESSFTRWHRSQAMIDLELKLRTAKSFNGKSLFRYFDGATMAGYQYPSRVTEEVFCRNIPQPAMCEYGHGWDSEHGNAHITNLEVRESKIPNAGRGVFAKQDVAEGSYIAIDESSHNLLVMPNTKTLIQRFHKSGIVNKWKMFDAYLYGYGFVTDYYGEPSISIDGSIMTFLNHGCNGTFNFRMSTPTAYTEITVDPSHYPDALAESPFEMQVYNPFVRRNHLIFQHGGESIGRNISAGEELLDSYLNYYTEDVWERAVTDLRAQCLAQGVGSVSAYEMLI